MSLAKLIGLIYILPRMLSKPQISETLLVSTSRGRSRVVSVSKIVQILVSVSTIRSFPVFVSVSKLRLTSESLSLGLES